MEERGPRGRQCFTTHPSGISLPFVNSSQNSRSSSYQEIPEIEQNLTATQANRKDLFVVQASITVNVPAPEQYYEELCAHL